MTETSIRLPMASIAGGIFAIVLILLAVDLAVLAASGPAWHGVATLARPEWLVLLLSLAVVAQYWISQSRRQAWPNPTPLGINTVFLIAVAVLPIAMVRLSLSAGSSASAVPYGLDLCAIAVLDLVLWALTIRAAGYPPGEWLAGRLGSGLAMLLYIAGTITVPKSADLALRFWYLGMLSMFIDWVRAHRVRRRSVREGAGR